MHPHAFAASAVKLTIEKLFPGPQIEGSPGNRDYHLPAHYLPLKVSICIIFPRPVVPIF